MADTKNESQQGSSPKSLRQQGKQETAARRQHNAGNQDPQGIEPIGEGYEHQGRNGISGQVRGKDQAGLGVVQSPLRANERKGRNVTRGGKQDEKQHAA